VLAGGQGSRLGGGDKPALEVGERSLLAWVVTAARAAAARRVVVVGPPPPGLESAAGTVRVVREDPPGSGPVAALRAGLAEVGAPWVAVLAADLPFLNGEHLTALLAAAGAPDRRRTGAAGAVLADESGRPQWLAGCWRTSVLRRAIGSYRGTSLHGLLGPLRPVLLALPPDADGRPPWLDCDTPEDLRRARAWRSRETAPGEGPR
jgi:molybdopterin-guanine dinucleotide biosynthesis protein A